MLESSGGGPRFEASWGIEAVFAEAQVVRDGVAGVRADDVFLQGDRVAPVPVPVPVKR